MTSWRQQLRYMDLHNEVEAVTFPPRLMEAAPTVQYNVRKVKKNGRVKCKVS
jgi:hypothetical protein